MANVTTEESPAVTTRPADSRNSNAPHGGHRRVIRAIVLVAAFFLVAAGSYYAWQYFSAYEDTDDAQIDGHINAIRERIFGYVSDGPVDNESYV